MLIYSDTVTRGRLGGRVTPQTRALELHAAATPATRALGAQWYPGAAAHARALGRAHGYTYHAAAGIIAALSPAQSWQGNLTRAAQVMADPNSHSGLMRAHRPALAIAHGARPLDVLGGPKVRAFYRNLTGNHRAVTIDRWMVRALLGSASDRVSPANYARAAQAVRAAAEHLGASPRDLQATIWCHVRGATA